MAGHETAQGVKHILHRDVFHPNKERIIGFIKVSKTEPGVNPFKKKTENVHYLCIHVTSKRPYQASIARFKKAESGEEYERRRNWLLEELTKVDGLSDSNSCLGLELWFGTVYKFQASTHQEKVQFLNDLADACSRYIQTTPPEFVRVNHEIQNVIQKARSDMSQLDRTKQQLNERGEKISELDKKTADMAESAKDFAENAHKLAMQHQ